MRCQQIAVCATALAFEETSVTLDLMCAMAVSFTAKIELYIYWPVSTAFCLHSHQAHRAIQGKRAAECTTDPARLLWLTCTLTRLNTGTRHDKQTRPSTEDTCRERFQQPQTRSRPLRAAGSPEYATPCHNPVASTTKPRSSQAAPSALAARYQDRARSACRGALAALGRKEAIAAARSGVLMGAQPASVQRMHRRASQDAVQPAELLLHHTQPLLQPRVLIAQHAGLRPEQRSYCHELGLCKFGPSRADNLHSPSSAKQTALCCLYLRDIRQTRQTPLRKCPPHTSQRSSHNEASKARTADAAHERASARARSSSSRGTRAPTRSRTSSSSVLRLACRPRSVSCFSRLGG